MRLFFAIWPSDSERERLSAVVRQHCRGRAVARDNLHLTLRFLGPITEDVRARLAEQAASLRGEVFDLVLDRMGIWARARVQWLGCTRTPDALQDLVGQLTESLRKLDIPPEPRPFEPHLTIARKVSGRMSPRAIDPVTLRVHEFVLVESETRPAGAVYRVLERWPLGP